MNVTYKLFLLMLAVGSLFAQAVKPVTARLAEQNALFEEQYASDLRSLRDRATVFGDYPYYDKLAERSLAAIVERHKADDLLEERTNHWITREKAQ
jgi:hypothetical protein